MANNLITSDYSVIKKAAEKIKEAERVIAFTGAGISVESGIPPFRGPDGLWSRYDPVVLDMNYFLNNPEDSWKVIKEIFYDFFGKAAPNPAHYALAELEKEGIIKNIITQNIDNLHQQAGSRNVIEFHGTSRTLACVNCGKKISFHEGLLESLPPRCSECTGLLKPDFIFFGEGIPHQAYSSSIFETSNADLWILVGTTGEIMPASMLPVNASENGAYIIEVNINESNYTGSITDLFIKGKASGVLSSIKKLILEE